MVKWFDDIRDEDFQLVGGKGFNLSQMFQAGIKVPNGYVVLSTTYDDYVNKNQLSNKIAEILNSEEDLDLASKQIKGLFTSSLLDASVKDELLKEVKKLNTRALAVRSSSTVEDLPGMSFAGQYSTYLNVTEADLIEKVILCWQSLWNVRAIDYRRKNQVTTEFSHGVVIQEMIDSKASGVVFTANPISGIRDELVVNTSYGLGEAIVSGEVNPDQFVLNKTHKRIINKLISKKVMMYKYGTSGIENKNVDEALMKSQSISDDLLLRVLKDCCIVENYFGKPQDIEIAIDEHNELFIVQSRDITTLFPMNGLEMDDKLRTYMSAGTVLLGMKEPFTPMGFDVMSQMFPTIINIMTAQKKPLTNSFVKHTADRMYVDMSYLMASKFVSKQFAKAFAGNDLPLQGVLDTVIETYGKQLTKQGIKFRLPLGVFKYGVKMSGGAIKITKIANDKRYDAMIDLGNSVYNEQLAVFESLNNIDDRIKFSIQALVEAFKLSQAQAMYCLDANNIVKIDKILKKNFGDQFRAETLVQSLPRCMTQTMTVLLNEYAKYCDLNNKQPSKDDPEFIKILDVYGHRANIELDLGTKRWREDPSYLLGLVDSYMNDKMYVRNLEDYEVKRQEALQLIDDVYEAMIAKKGKKAAEKFKTLMINYRTGAGMREYPKSDIVRFMELSRKALFSVGEELVGLGKLESAEDVFFVHQDDILNGRELKSLVIANKESYNKEMKRTSIPRIIMNNGATYYTTTVVDPDSKIINGMALSPGVYEGVIRVVFDPMTTDLQEGEILVTESTNPAWTPLFASAGALIMEYGGPMSHGGIVAREYGIPAVVGIPSATSLLKDGQRVRVNGESGVIEFIE